MTGLLIGDVAARTGVSAPTIRYYESIGLLKAPARSAAGYRRYGERTVTELLFVRKAQALGFGLDEIGEILKLSRSGKAPCARVLDLSRRHLDAIDERIAQLQRFRTYLAAELDKWSATSCAVTEDGLCDFISGAAPEGISVAFDSGRPRKSSRSVRA